MLTPVNDEFRADARAYRLRFTCEHCAHFEPESGTCSEEFPNDSHRAADLDRTRHVVFCKSFELY